MLTIKKLKNSVLIATLILFTSCDEKPIFENNIVLNNNEWNYNDTISMKFKIKDTISKNNLSINIRNTSIYPYYNMFTFLQIKNKKNFNYKDTIEFNLANPASGKWIGNGSSGIYYNTILFKQLKFPHKGEYEVNILHGMRDSILDGINAVGFKIN